MNTKKYVWIENAQLISMLLVVLHHSIPNGYEVNTTFNTIANSVHYPALAVFFFCSGFLGHNFKKYCFKQYLKKRTIRLLLPFVVVNLLMLFPKMLIAKLASESIDISVNMLISAFLNPHGEGICPHLWYLPTLMIMCLMLPFFDLISRERKKLTIILVCVLICISVLPTNITTWFCLNEIRMYLCFFVIGFICGEYGIFEKISKNIEIILCPVSMFCMIFLLIFRDDMLVFPFLMSFFGMIFILALSRLIANRLEDIRRWFSGKTFCIYILSLCIQNLVEVIGRKLFDAWYITSILMFITGIVVPMIIYYVLKKMNERRIIPSFVLNAFGINGGV